jgi:hypothetical protein
MSQKIGISGQGVKRGGPGPPVRSTVRLNASSTVHITIRRWFLSFAVVVSTVHQTVFMIRYSQHKLTRTETVALLESRCAWGNVPRGAPKVCPLLDSMRHLPWGYDSVTTRTNRAAVGSSCTRRTRGRACNDRARLGRGLVAGKRLDPRPYSIRAFCFARAACFRPRVSHIPACPDRARAHLSSRSRSLRDTGSRRRRLRQTKQTGSSISIKLYIVYLFCKLHHERARCKLQQEK